MSRLYLSCLFSRQKQTANLVNSLRISLSVQQNCSLVAPPFAVTKNSSRGQLSRIMWVRWFPLPLASSTLFQDCSWILNRGPSLRRGEFAERIPQEISSIPLLTLGQCLLEVFEGLEPCEGKVSRTVLRGLDGSNLVPPLEFSADVEKPTGWGPPRSH